MWLLVLRFEGVAPSFPGFEDDDDSRFGVLGEISTVREGGGTVLVAVFLLPLWLDESEIDAVLDVREDGVDLLVLRSYLFLDTGLPLLPRRKFVFVVGGAVAKLAFNSFKLILSKSTKEGKLGTQL